MRYKSGAAFRRALEDRLLTQSEQTRLPLVRLRKMVAFDRFLARLVRAYPDQWLLKGGLALQLRLGLRARTTLDVDVLLLSPTDQLHEVLVRAARLDLDDWFEFTVAVTTAQLPWITEAGQRFAVTALLDGRLFEAFHLDVGTDDPVMEPANYLAVPPILAFASIEPATIPCYPVTQHLAEKLHAYVRPRATGANTRVKDLVDIVLIAEQLPVGAGALLASLDATFAARGKPALPGSLPDPPPAWATSFHRLAAEVGLTNNDLPAAVAVAHAFFDPVLQRQAHGTWQPGAQSWI
jgi:hypothetical protein